MKQFLLGIDNGGTVIKAALFDTAGNEIASASRKTELIVPNPGHIERDMEILWKANYQAISETIQNAKVDSKDIIGVAVTGHGNGLYMVDSQGLPVGHGILSADSRSESYVEQWDKDGTASSILPKTCQAIWAGQPVSILSWLKDHNQSLLESDKVRWVFMCKDYIRYKLTGDAFAEITDYSGTNMVNVKTLEYDRDILRAFNLEDLYEKLPPLCGSTEQCGRITKEASQLTGLKEGTPVYGGLFDIDASAVGTGITSSDVLCIVAGTWSINQFISPVPIASDELFMCSAFCMPETWLITEGSPTSACNLEWFVSQVMPKSEYGENPFITCNEIVSNLQPESSDVIFLPFLFGSNVGASASSAFLGMKGWHTVEHLVRAVFEGIVFSHMTHFERLEKHHPGFNKSRIAGGASRSPQWVQMFADMLQLPIEIPNNKELGALGAAMCAGVGAGVFPSFQDASQEMVHIHSTIYPEKEKKEVYRKKYGRYKKVIEVLKEFWQG